jgi:hypothetical protein
MTGPIAPSTLTLVAAGGAAGSVLRYPAVIATGVAAMRGLLA